ncbi:carboxypeptidase-like regulatory domain-containing protein [Bizionia myxarmorum]|uniref:Carboxypeptidase-like regulatory domain-containing protein n=1 Tax=Bizionia myxarmorum TaxID=291186 RepID=A0A5D0RG75_9FLAO|nr:carboxypeptidase-like regulatory domain-containing protein [Bizionia myxarmorum]TYB79698.1 hypothetical protein ES674_08090 [Bizionia myxarmorum]
MRKALTITIPEPCHENWNNMSPNEKGRFCKACDKIVHDFTTKTNEQIVKTIMDHGQVCGRFKTNQLNKELVYSRKSKNSFRTILASGFFSMLTFSSYRSLAQTKPETVQTDSIKAPSVLGKPAVSILHSNKISGTILDETNLPLPGANVVIKNKTIGTQTDFYGNFEIEAKVGDIITISFIGYETKEVTVALNQSYKFSLDIDSDVLGGMVITSYGASYSKSPLSPAKSTYSPTDAELEKSRIKKLKRKNYFDFYKRKN